MPPKLYKRIFWLIVPLIWFGVGAPWVLTSHPSTQNATFGAINFILALAPGILIILMGGIWKKSFHNYIIGRIILGYYLSLLAIWYLIAIVSFLDSW